MFLKRRNGTDGEEKLELYKWACPDCFDKSRYPKNSIIYKNACEEVEKTLDKIEYNNNIDIKNLAINKEDDKGRKCAYILWTSIKHVDDNPDEILDNTFYSGEGELNYRSNQHFVTADERYPCCDECVIKNKVTKKIVKAWKMGKMVKAVSIRLKNKTKSEGAEHAILGVLKSPKMTNKQKGVSKKVEKMKPIFAKKLGVDMISKLVNHAIVGKHVDIYFPPENNNFSGSVKRSRSVRSKMEKGNMH